MGMASPCASLCSIRPLPAAFQGTAGRGGSGGASAGLGGPGTDPGTVPTRPQSLDLWCFDVFALQRVTEEHSLRTIVLELFSRHNLSSRFKVPMPEPRVPALEAPGGGGRVAARSRRVPIVLRATDPWHLPECPAGCPRGWLRQVPEPLPQPGPRRRRHPDCALLPAAHWHAGTGTGPGTGVPAALRGAARARFPPSPRGFCRRGVGSAQRLLRCRLGNAGGGERVTPAPVWAHGVVVVVGDSWHTPVPGWPPACWHLASSCALLARHTWSANVHAREDSPSVPSPFMGWQRSRRCPYPPPSDAHLSPVPSTT